MVYGCLVVRNETILMLVEKQLNVMGRVIWYSCKLHFLIYSHLKLVLKLIVLGHKLYIKLCLLKATNMALLVFTLEKVFLLFAVANRQNIQ